MPPNAGLKLFGGAAFERCLNEFQEAAHALKFPASERGQEGGRSQGAGLGLGKGQPKPSMNFQKTALEVPFHLAQH